MLGMLLPIDLLGSVAPILGVDVMNKFYSVSTLLYSEEGTQIEFWKSIENTPNYTFFFIFSNKGN